MKATYNASAKTKWTTSHRKEGKCFFESLQVIDLDVPPHRDKTASVPIDLRLYGTGNQNFACLWIRHENNYAQGSGRAGGYGYHRPSAAANEAIHNAGFVLSQDIGGVGESAILEAVCAIAECIGLKNYSVIRSHP